MAPPSVPSLSKTYNLRLLDVLFLFGARTSYARRVSIGYNQVRYISNNGRTRPHYRVISDRNSVRYAGANSDRRAFANFHQSPHRNAGSDARVIAQNAVVVYRASRIDNTEFSDSGVRTNMGASKNHSPLANFCV